MAELPTGSSGIPLLGPIINALQSVLDLATDLSSLRDSVSAVETAAWTNLLNISSFAWGTLNGTLDFLGQQLDWLKKLLTHVLVDVIYKHIKALFDAVRKWITNLHNWIKVHVATLQKIQKQLNDARMKELKRVIDLIQRIRKVLVIFRIFHLKFAQKLDNFLAGIEGKLIGGVFNVARKTNEIALWTNVLLDPRGALRSGTLWWALNRDAAAASAAAKAIGLGKLFPGLAQIFGGGVVGRGTFAGTRKALRDQLTTNSGAYGDYHAGAQQSFAELEREAKP